MKLSGIQRDVLALYRNCLRACRQKPRENQERFKAHVRREFRKNLHIGKREFATIEYLLRKGDRQLELYSSSGVKDIK